MEQFIMKGGNPLVGEVTISGAKNAALGILAASILTDEDVLIENLPDVRDINVFLEAVSEIGAMVDRIDRHHCPHNAKGIMRSMWMTSTSAGTELPTILLAPCLASIKAHRFRLPGGCQHRQPSDRPAFKGLPCPRCEGTGGKWRGARTCD